MRAGDNLNVILLVGDQMQLWVKSHLYQGCISGSNLMEELISPKESTFPCYSDWCNFGLQEPLEKSCVMSGLFHRN